MPRRPRTIFPEIAHHITQRGNNREQVFFSPRDYLRYLNLLKHYCAASSIEVKAFCLMPNHIHLIAIPTDAASLSRALGRIHSEYALNFNLTKGRCGHLWQSRFFSCPLDREHFRKAIAYCERNPVRAGFVDEPHESRWSSAHPAHSSYSSAGERVIEFSDDEADRIRRATRVGEPLGSSRFLMELEQQAGRELRVRARGRPAQEEEEGKGDRRLFRNGL
jgi:putative transposase